jgi:hypothetical protein
MLVEEVIIHTASSFPILGNDDVFFLKALMDIIDEELNAAALI